MDFTKFVDLIDRSTLYFARADHLGDSWEGSLSRRTLEIEEASLRAWIPQLTDGEREVIRIREHSARSRERQAKFMMISSWYEAQHESAAMWALYVRQGAGIAVKSSFGNLERALPKDFPQFIYAGRVGYNDYERDTIPSNNYFAPFLRKRLSFEHEHELRVMLDVITPEHIADYELPATIERGVHVPVDLDVLVSAVRVAPTAPSWLLELVKRTASRYGLGAPVERSSLDDGPVY